MKNYQLKTRADYLNLAESLEQQKFELLKLQKGTEGFEKKLKRFIKSVA